MTCVCGHPLTDHDPEVGWLCMIWREESEDWCPCLLFVEAREQTYGTNSITITIDR